jgi:PAS domain S-box-containing protein
MKLRFELCVEHGLAQNEDMQGILSESIRSGRLSYYRSIAAVGVLYAIFTSACDYFIAGGISPAIGLQSFLVLAGSALVVAPYWCFSSKRQFVLFNYAYFYLYTAVIVANAWFFNFDLIHTLFIILAFQCIALSFSSPLSSACYLAFIGSIMLLALNTSAIAIELNALMTAMFALILVFNYFLTKIKCKVVSDIVASRDLLKALVNKTENAIFVADPKGHIIDCNERATELFGYRKEEMIGKDFAMFRKDPLTEEEVQFGLLELEMNNFWSMRKPLIDQHGKIIPSYIYVAKIQRTDEVYLVYRVKDISDQEHHEREMNLAMEKAREAVIAKTQFLATMSHEIRTPLNGVIGMASLLQSSELNADQREYADTILKSGQSLMVLLNDILDLSKLESGKMTPQYETVVLSDRVLDVIELLRPYADAKGVAIHYNIAPGIPECIMSDEARIRQVLLNLIGNAVKFTPQGEVRVSLDLESQNHDEAEIRIRVQDTGIGIPEEKIHLLFQTFSQVDSTNRRKFGGTGLGLAISKEIAEMLGGRITVKSVEYQGSCFDFFIKAKITDKIKVNCNYPLHSLVNFSQLQNLRILIVEDNLVNQKVLLYMLESMGLKADVCGNGLEAVAACATVNYDIVFMDFQMPELSGTEAAREIIASGSFKGKIIAMTANSSDDDRREAANAGMDYFMSKPFIIEQVKDILALCVGGGNNIDSMGVAS